MIELRNITKEFKSGSTIIKAIDKVSLLLPNNGLVFITGKSGCGKSTLLNILGTLEQPDNGEFLINGNAINKMSKRELNRFRNANIGFVFQDFNLFDSLDVFTNIELALNSKNKKKNLQIIKKRLKDVGLEEFEKRKVAHLSGGERQRVAIARALVKEPQILLCDEPTGNLDSKNSKAIFDLLKNISSKTLVLVVTHDEKMAQEYSNNIIKLKDGKVVNNRIKIKIQEDTVINKTQSKLGMKNKVMLAWSNIKKRKVRFIASILASVIAFVGFAFLTTLNGYDQNKVHIDSMIHENEIQYRIVKNEEGYLLPNDLRYINELTSSSKNRLSELIINNVSFRPVDIIGTLKDEFNDSAFDVNIDNHFRIYNNDDLYRLDIIGEYPDGPNEILLTEMAAYELIKYQVNTVLASGNIFPNNFDEIDDLIGKTVHPSANLKITGIAKETDTSKFLPLLNESLEKMKMYPTELYEEFVENYGEESNYISFIVSENFFEQSNFKPNYGISDLFYKYSIKTTDMEIFEDNSVIATYPMFAKKYYDGKTEVSYSDVAENQIIISHELLIALYPTELGNVVAESMDEASKINQQRQEERDKLLEEYTVLKEQNPDFEIPKLPEVEKVSYIDIYTKKLHDAFNKHNVLGQEVEFTIKDTEHIVQKNEYETYKLEIIGLIADSSVVNSHFEKYGTPHELTTFIEVFESDERELLKTFDSLDTEKYSIQTKFNHEVEEISSFVKNIFPVVRVISIVFLAISVILLSMFLYMSINENNKKIGILRSLGVRTKDIIDIFLIENYLVGWLTLVFSSISITMIMSFANRYLSDNMGFYLNIFSLDVSILLIMLFAIILTIFTSSVIPIIHIVRMNPMKIILNSKE